ncbi:MAG: dihydrolipoyl dehydrogenase [Armatimonadetes bacterium]|nr:dihydrolipoyl dehydrogenase [Armatimonadota bacterium]MDE2205809.1 dihydrolipoyl dehydrogenase [Armatimonadota bacterium]
MSSKARKLRTGGKTPTLSPVATLAVADPPTGASTSMNAEQQAVVERLLGTTPQEHELMAASGDYDADIVVIGSGPAGYVCAIRAAQLGARTVCIEREAAEWGGTCLNWGCIPTKAMIASVERLHHVKTAGPMGVTISGEIGFDFAAMMARKAKIVTTLRGGVQSLLKSNHVRCIVGTAEMKDAHTVVTALSAGGSETVRTRCTIIATGSVPVMPPVPGLERKPSDARGVSSNGIWTSDEAVCATEPPTRFVVIGGGAVGLEFAYTFRNLGSEVNLIEMAPEILPLADAEIASGLRKSLERQGIKFHLGSQVSRVEHKRTGRIVHVTTPTGEVTLEADAVLVGAGRRAWHDGLGLSELGVVTDRRGIVVDEYLQTNVPGIYAIGDVVGKQLLAHLGSHMGIVAAENAMGHPVKMDYRAVPAPIYTVPEVATVGLSEEQARAEGYDVMTGRFAFRPLGRAMALGEQEGLVKVVSERKYGELLGVHIFGPYATELIHEGVMAIKLESTIDELMTNIHAHPTLSEAIGEAALDVKGEAIHKPRK